MQEDNGRTYEEEYRAGTSAETAERRDGSATSGACSCSVRPKVNYSNMEAVFNIPGRLDDVDECERDAIEVCDRTITLRSLANPQDDGEELAELGEEVVKQLEFLVHRRVSLIDLPCHIIQADIASSPFCHAECRRALGVAFAAQCARSAEPIDGVW